MEQEETHAKTAIKTHFLDGIFYGKWTIVLLFIVFFFYAMFLLQGLSFYMYGYDDFHLIYQALSVRFLDLLQSILFHPLQLFQGFLHLGIYQRAVHGLFIKVSYMIGGLDPSFYHIVRALFFAFNGILVYLFTKKITKNSTTAILAGSLYCSFPVVYDGLRHIGAAEPFAEFFMLATLYVFVHVYEKEETYTGWKKYSNVLIIFILGLFAIKVRETGILILAAFGGFLIVQHKDFRKNAKWWIVLVMLSLYLLPTAFSHFDVGKSKEQQSISITTEQVLTNIKHLLFYNPQTRTGTGEQTSVIFSLRQYLSETPGSLLGSFGFFIGWYTIMMIFVFIYYFFSKKEKKILPSIILSNNYFTIALLWFVVSILLIILYVNVSDHSDIRYISVMALPAILVIIPFCYFVTAYVQQLQIKYVSKYILVIFFVLLVLSIVVNAGITSIYRRGGIGSRHNGMAMSTEAIFEDFYNHSFDNSYFFALTEISGDDKEIACTLHTDVPLKEVIVTNDPFLSFVRPITEENIEVSLSAYGVVYVLSYAEPLTLETYTTNTTIELIRIIDGCQKGLFCNTVAFLQKKSIFSTIFKKQLDRQPQYLVYKIQREKETYKNVYTNKNVSEAPITMFCVGKQGLPQNRV